MTILWSYCAAQKNSSKILQLNNFKLETSRVTNDSVFLTIQAITSTSALQTKVSGLTHFTINKEDKTLQFKKGLAICAFPVFESKLLLFEHDGEISTKRLVHVSVKNKQITLQNIPFWLVIMPPLLAILFALVFKEVIVSLFAGIWFGAFIISGLSFSNLFSSLLRVIDTYILNALNNGGHLSVIIFSLMIGGMVAIISANGGMQGVVNILSRYATTARSAQLVTWLMGILIFFDDYANSLIVGNTMRPVTDKFKISRAKLAYIVDSTAAPVAAIAFTTTWIGAELGYIEDAIQGIGIEQSAYSMFINSLKYAYYPIFTLVFIFLLIYFKKDFGSMYDAELKSRNAGINNAEEQTVKLDEKMEVKAGINPKWYNAFIPVAALIFATIISLFYTGYDSLTWANNSIGLLNKLSITIGNADSYVALLWSSLIGLGLALLLTIGGRIMSVKESIEVMVHGFTLLIPALLILVSAWALALVTEELFASTFLTHLLLGKVNPWLLPLVTFILASIISFSTGSSWSTMAILYPIILPTAWTISNSFGLEYADTITIMYNVTAVVIAGSVLGDHCSPISDTTILSSLACNCNHIEHVRTQLPYALIVGIISIISGGVLFYFGWPWWLNYMIGFGLLIFVIQMFGKKTESDIIKTDNL